MMDLPAAIPVNNAPLLFALGRRLDIPQYLPVPSPRPRLLSDPVLPSNLPPTGFIQREAEHGAPRAMTRQMQRMPPPSPPPDLDEDFKRRRRASSASTTSSSSFSLRTLAAIVQLKDTRATNSWKEPEPYQIFRAIEAKDVMFLMEIRDRAFHLLLQRHGGVTPLVHAMQIRNKDVAIVLLGSFSRWVNRLEDDDMKIPRTRELLKIIRANLKYAIDYGLSQSQSDLIASFLQTLIMSEGDKWVLAQASNVALALRAGTSGKPVQTAQDAVRKFATKALTRADMIASLEDYIGNATADLLMMGAWSAVLNITSGEQIPSYYFARDDRVFKAFTDRLDQQKSAIETKVGKRLKWQLRVLRNVMDGRSTSYRSKVDSLAYELDQGPGV